MKKALFLAAALPLAGGLTAHKPAPTAPVVTVRNRLNVARPAETVSVSLSQLKALGPVASLRGVVVKDTKSNAVLTSQLLDSNADGQPDELLFQAALPAKGSRQFVLAAGGAAPVPAEGPTTFARFVPERTDDFAWENERVAFRTYGPVAEQLFD